MSIEEVLINPKVEKLQELNNLIKKRKLELNYIEEYIFDSHDSRLIYLCGKHIEWINKGRVAHALSLSKDGYYILKYASYITKNKSLNPTIKETIINELAKGMCRSKSAPYIYSFLKYISATHMEKLIKAILKLDDPTYLFYTARDFSSQVNADLRISLGRKIINLKEARYIIFIAKCISEISINEYAEGLLNAHKNNLYGVHLNMFLKDNDIEDQDLRNKLIAELLKTSDYKSIVNLIKNTDIPYTEIIDSILTENNNYQKPDFWLNYIIPIAISKNASASYATSKIIESNNIEIISIAIYYIEDEELRNKLEESLKQIPSFETKLRQTRLNENVITRIKHK